MITIVANYRTGSSTFYRSLGGVDHRDHGTEYLHNNICEYRPPSPEFSVYKVMPDQFYYEKYYENFKEDYLRNSDEIYYTVRENICDQINSHIYAGKTSDWHPWQGVGIPNLSEEQHIVDACKTMILNCVKWQAKIYKEWGGTLIWLEDRNDGKKYSRRIDYTPPHINIDIDVKSMFL